MRSYKRTGTLWLSTTSKAECLFKLTLHENGKTVLNITLSEGTNLGWLNQSPSASRLIRGQLMGM
jgi:hypothetical protein